MTDTNTPYKGEGETVYATAPERESEPEGKDWPDHTDPEWLKYQYCILNRNSVEMANIAGVAPNTVRWHMEKHGIERRSKSKAVSMARGGHEKSHDEEWLRDQYSNGVTLGEIAEKLDVTQAGVWGAFERLGIERRSNSEAQKLRCEREFGSEKYNDKKWLYNQYWRLGKSAEKIADENGWHSSTVIRALDRHGIQKRSNKAALLLSWKKKKCTPVEESRGLVSSEGIDASWQDLKDVKRGCVVPYRDKQWLQDCINSGMTNSEIACVCACEASSGTIRNWIDRLNIDRPDEGAPSET